MLTTESAREAIWDAPILAYWRGPAFDPKQLAFCYCVRVLEIPTARWTACDAGFFGATPPEGVAPTHRERAYT